MLVEGVDEGNEGEHSHVEASCDCETGFNIFFRARVETPWLSGSSVKSSVGEVCELIFSWSSTGVGDSTSSVGATEMFRVDSETVGVYKRLVEEIRADIKSISFVIILIHSVIWRASDVRAVSHGVGSRAGVICEPLRVHVVSVIAGLTTRGALDSRLAVVFCFAFGFVAVEFIGGKFKVDFPWVWGALTGRTRIASFSSFFLRMFAYESQWSLSPT